MKTDYDVIIIGAGPAGSVSSAYLVNNGRSVLVLEKQTFPRFVIGESLLPHCMDHLQETGLLETIKAKGFQVKTGAAFYKGNSRTDFLFENQHSQGWTWTWQVKRADFDKALIDESERKGTHVKYACEVIAVKCSRQVQEITYRSSDGAIINSSCRFLLDASGYGRVLPRLMNLELPVSTPPRGAVFCHIEDSKRTQHAGENIFIHSFNNNTAWIWAIPFSDRTTSVGVVSDIGLVEKFSSDNGKLFLEHIRTFHDLNNRFTNEQLVFEPCIIRNYAARTRTNYGTGFALCGNATEFLDPIFSSGVTLATGSGLLAAKLVHRQLNAENIDWETEYENILRSGVDAFRSFVEAWYRGDMQKIFFAKETQESIRKQICSILAGYVWDSTNPFVRKHKSLIRTLAEVIRMNEN